MIMVDTSHSFKAMVSQNGSLTLGPFRITFEDSTYL